MSCCAGSLPAHFAEDAQKQADILKLEELKRQANTLPDGSVLLRLNVPDVHCVACISSIERKLAKTQGIQTARVNLTLRQLTVNVCNFDSLSHVVRALDELGYRHHAATEALGTDPELKRLVRALAVSGFAATNVMLLSVSVWNGAETATRDLFHFVSALIALPAVAFAGQPFFKSAFQSLRHRRMNMDVPISLGVLLATGMSLYESVAGGGDAYFDAAISLLFFLLIGRVLDLMMRGRARQLVTRMAELSTKGGMRLMDDGTLNYVQQSDIVPGMMLRIASGERLPADAIVVDGASFVDRSLVTGESAPLSAVADVQLEAGVLNISSPLDVKVLRSAAKSFLGEVTQMLAAAEEGRGHYVRLADRMARIYSPAVHILALLTFAIWMFDTDGAWHQSLTVAVAVLIITCPCALGLAVPVAHVVAASNLFKRGILVKDGSALERLAEINHATFDKTGTLTDSCIQIIECSIPEGEFCGIALALAQASHHPAAQALRRNLHGTLRVVLQNVKETAGLGVEATYNGQICRLGRASWVSEITKGQSPASGLAFGIEHHPHMTINLRESLRTGARQVISTLASRGIASEILSGDRRETVETVALQLGVSKYAAELKPADKLRQLKSLMDNGQKVLMVGDGLNDAPALAAAHVSMAPSSASDIGRTAADFVFMGDSLKAIEEAHSIALRAKRIVQQNFALAALYNTLAVPLAMSGYLNPLFAAIAMSTSSLIVVGNSLRLSDWDWPKLKCEPSSPDTVLEASQ